MADAICCSVASKPLNNSILHFTASKPCFVIPSVSFQNSIHTTRRTKRRHLLHFTCLSAPNSPLFDVISTHEHSDGSFVFRFGDLSEVGKNDRLEEANLEVDGKGTGVEDDTGVVNIMESDHRREVMGKSVEGEEKSEDPIGVQMHVSRSSLEICDSSEITDQVDNVLLTRGSIALNHSVGFDEDDLVHSERSVEMNGSSESVSQVENVVFREECLVENAGYESQFAPSPCPPDHASGPEDDGTSAEIAGPLSGKSKELISLEPNHVVEVTSDNDHVKEPLIDNDVDQREASLSSSLSKHGSGPKDNEFSAEITEPLTGRNQELVPAKLDSVIELPVDDDGKKTSQENIEVAHASNNVDATNEEAGSQNNSVGDSNNSDIVEMLSLSSPLETEPPSSRNQELVPAKLDSVIEVPVDDGKKTSQENIEVAHASNNVDAKNEKARSQNNPVGDRNNSEIIEMLSLETEPSLHKERNAKNVEVGTQNDIMGRISESDVIGKFPSSLPLLAEPVLGEEGDAKSEEIKTQDDVQGGSCGRVVIRELPVSLPFGVEPVLDKGGATTKEVGSHIDITGSSSESEGIGTLPLSLLSEAEPVLDEGGVKVVEVGTRNDIMRNGSETEVIGELPPSPPLEAEPFSVKEEDAKKVEGGTENDIKGGSSESKIILTLPLPPPLEVQPTPDNEAELELTEIFEESFRSGTAVITNTSSRIMEIEVNSNESAGTDEPVDSSDGDKTVSKPIITDLQSEKILLEKLFLSSGTASLPHPEKALAGGEDACFTCRNWLGVADGVSQWSLEGVDHGKYAHEVMEIAHELVSSCCDTPLTSPKEVLNLAVDRAHYPGCSTVLISHFDGQDLHVANIGDSRIIIISNDAVCQRSSPMYHEYNFPVLVQREVDSSKLVEQYTFSLDEGDVVVSATDGLFNNLYEADIISIVSKSFEANMNPKEIAEILAMRAQEVGVSTCTRSPFSDEAQAEGYTGCTGGKLDDVVVVVSLVKKRFDF